MELISLFVSSSFVFVTTWLAGCLFSIPLLGNATLPSHVAFFTRLAIGYIVILVGTSLYHTGGYTIFIGVFIIYTAIVVLKRKELKQAFSTPFFAGWKHLLVGLAILPILLFLLLYRNGYFDGEIIYGSYQDNGIYTTVAEYLKITGKEVSSPWYQTLDLSADGVAKVYHYEDFWFMAYALSPLDVYNYVFTSVLTLFCFFGNMALCVSLNERCNISRWLVPVSFFLVLFNMCIPGARWTNYFDVNAFAYPRIAALPILLSLTFVSKRYQLRHVDSLALSVLILADVLFMPTLLASATLLCIFQWYLKRRWQNLNDLFFLVFMVGFFLTFYLLFGSMDNSSTTISPPGNRGYWYYFAKNIAAAHLKHLIFFFPSYLALLFLFFRRKGLDNYFKSFLGMLLTILVFSSFFTALMNNNVEGLQFTSLVHTTASAMLTLGCLVILWQLPETKRWRIHIRRILICFLFLQIIYGVFASTTLQHFRNFGVQASFLNHVKQKMEHLNKIGAAISNPEKATSYTIDPRICQYCNFLKQAGDAFWVNQLTVPATLEDISFIERTKAVEMSPFFRFMERLRAEDRFTNVEAAQLEFIKTYNVDFVVLEKGATIPELIIPCVKSSLKDDYSGTTVLFLYETCPN
jgi:hypothetical protein